MRDKITGMLPAGLARRLYALYADTAMFVRKALARDGICSLSGVKVHADKDRLGDQVVRLIYRGDYEGREARMVRSFLEKDDRVLELGAGIGFIGLLCARTVGPENVHSFEANPLMEPVIRAHYDLNDCQPNLNIGMLCEGLSETEVTLHVPDLFWAASTTPMDGAREVKTPVLSLNEYIHKINPTFVIMDIEGGEIDFAEQFDPHTIRKIAMETHSGITGKDAMDRMKSRLAEKGFELRWSSRPGEHLYFERKT